MKSHTLKLFLFLLIALLAACESQPVKTGGEQAVTEEGRPVTEKQASLTEEAENLLELAEDSDNEAEQRKYRIQAAQLYIEAGEISLANQQLDVLRQQYADRAIPDETANTDIQLLAAAIAIAQKNTSLAAELIDSIKPLTRKQQISYYSLKADLDYLSGKYMFAVERRVQLDTYLDTEGAKNRNNRKIWAALSSLPSEQLNKQQSSNPTIKGWLELAKVMRSGQQNISKLEDDLLDWGTRNPSHPVGNSFLQELVSNYQVTALENKQIAVLLPMQGDLSKVTATIKNGILSAYYLDSTSPIKPVIRFYDTSNSDQSFHQVYEQAIEDGATNIIGPLDKVVINRLAQQRELDVPVLTLNYSESTFGHTGNLFQFGLSPEDEAHQVAELAILQNKKQAAVFYPDSEWGRRLNRAFVERYTFLGGSILTSTNYATNTNDYRRPIRQLFNLDQSAIRRRKVENIIGTRTKSEPRRRQDIDMIFLAATHRSARSIMPAFKFHHAGDLPVYSTSHVYTGQINRELDRDLNGLIFCDMPWILQNTSPLAKVFTSNWPQQKNFTRLFALGIDSYHLIFNLDYLQNREYAVYAGQTGNIQLDENNRVTRKLLWARFERGRPVYFEPAINSEETEKTAN